ncbi:MAG: serine/threonine protein kinase [Deltaproteobacteria bacterium]|nr:serine/threonine protein kinase [Deltaproteobacteria bacterium]
MSERFGAYTLHEKLGQGGMAVVYRGERLGEAGFKKRVAIKRILPQYRRDASLLERFAAEARTNARLDHPNLVQVLDFGIDPEPYLALELIEGVSLSQVMQRLLARGEKLDVSAMLFISAEVANGLDHAHRKRGDDGTPLGIVHRDMSPQNVLISNEGAVKVSDFGLVKAADNVLKTASGITIGKLSYMAPEQADGKDIDGRADLFAMGVTMWEMLTLRSLIPPDDAAQATQLLQHGGFEPPSRYRDGLPGHLDRLIMQCLAIDREARMPSAQQLSSELREMLHERAAGYDRQQLARMLAWLFPEKGWGMPEPDLPAVQPSAEERASMMPVTPATVAMARHADSERPPAVPASVSLEPGRITGPIADPSLVGLVGALPRGSLAPPVMTAAPATLPRPSVEPARPPSVVPPPQQGVPVASHVAPSKQRASTPSARTSSRRGLWTALLVLSISLGLAAIGVVGLTVTGWHLASQPQRGALRIESSTPGLELYLGPTSLGPAPVDLDPHEIVGQPILAIAPGYEPRILRAERIAELTRADDHVERIDLAASRLPSTILYVRYDGQGTAYSNEGFGVLGSVPGALRIQNGSAADLTIIDEQSGRRIELRWQPCAVGSVCVLDAR